MRHVGLVVALKLLGSIVAMIGVLVAFFLFVKGMQIIDNQYTRDAGMYFLLGGLATASFSCLSGATGFGIAALIQDAQRGRDSGTTQHVAARFTVSSDGVINDAETGLEWVVEQDRSTNYAQAEQWVAACNVAGGRWRMPTRQELKSLYQPGLGEHSIDPVFKFSGASCWAEPRDSSSAWGFVFYDSWYGGGHLQCYDRDSVNLGVFGVRSRQNAPAQSPARTTEHKEDKASVPLPLL